MNEFAHNIAFTLDQDKPDACIINVGCNNLRNDPPHDIVNEIMDTVRLCHEKGVNEVFVATIPFRMEKAREAEAVNDLLIAKSSINDFIIINNSNITRSHISGDFTHLNNDGLQVIANNFIRSLNDVHRD